MAIAPPEVPAAVVRWLTRHSITVLRVCTGIVFLAFAIPKFQPGLSPAEDLARETVNALTLHLINGHAAVLLTAEMETFIGLTLITGWALRAGLAVMSVAMIGILSPLVLFTSQLFAHGISLEAQYVFKDIVLVASGLVIAAHALGARLKVDGLETGEEIPALAPAPQRMQQAMQRPLQRTPVAAPAVRWGAPPASAQQMALQQLARQKLTPAVAAQAAARQTVQREVTVHEAPADRPARVAPQFSPAARPAARSEEGPRSRPQRTQPNRVTRAALQQEPSPWGMSRPAVNTADQRQRPGVASEDLSRPDPATTAPETKTASTPRRATGRTRVDRPPVPRPEPKPMTVEDQLGALLAARNTG